MRNPPDHHDHEGYECWICYWCGEFVYPHAMALDHVDPVGSSKKKIVDYADDEMKPTHSPCNDEKGSIHIPTHLLNKIPVREALRAEGLL